MWHVCVTCTYIHTSIYEHCTSTCVAYAHVLALTMCRMCSTVLGVVWFRSRHTDGAKKERKPHISKSDMPQNMTVMMDDNTHTTHSVDGAVNTAVHAGAVTGAHDAGDYVDVTIVDEGTQGNTEDSVDVVEDTTEDDSIA